MTGPAIECPQTLPLPLRKRKKSNERKSGERREKKISITLCPVNDTGVGAAENINKQAYFLFLFLTHYCIKFLHDSTFSHCHCYHSLLSLPCIHPMTDTRGHEGQAPVTFNSFSFLFIVFSFSTF